MFKLGWMNWDFCPVRIEVRDEDVLTERMERKLDKMQNKGRERASCLKFAYEGEDVTVMIGRR
jgi:hypothetical protein